MAMMFSPVHSRVNGFWQVKLVRSPDYCVTHSMISYNIILCLIFD